MIKNPRRLIFNILFVLIILFPIVMLATWVFSKKKPINILILDKTVLTTGAQEHKSLNWILKHRKYVKPDLSWYKKEKDYLGFFPKENKEFDIQDLSQYTLAQIDSISEQLDMVYYTDLYGIYYNEWYRDTLHAEHSRKIYGGMEYKEYHLLKRMKEQKKLIITEFNNIGTPTPQPIRQRVEKMLGFKWSGWTLRYFESLDTLVNKEIPLWIIDSYIDQHGNWSFSEPGIVFVHESEKIFILESPQDLDFEVPEIQTIKYAHDKFNIPSRFIYPFWIDITSVTDTANTILAYYRIYSNERGDSILDYYNVPSIFPAIYERLDDYTFYYFAGDFCDNQISSFSTYFRGVSWMKRWLSNREDYQNRSIFFWNYYYPMMKVILRDYYQNPS